MTGYNEGYDYIANNEKIALEENQDVSRLRNLGLPEEVLKTLVDIKKNFSNEQKDEEPHHEVASKKVIIEQGNKDLSHLYGMGLPDEVLKTLKDIRSANTVETKKKVDFESELTKLKFNPETGSFTLPKDVLSKVKTSLQQSKTEYIKNQFLAQNNLPATVLSPKSDAPPPPPPPGKAMISDTVDYTVEEKTSLVRSMQISEEGIFLGIILNITTIAEAITIINGYSTNKISADTNDHIVQYDDLAITLYSENDVITQLEFRKGFEGATSRGLRIGDNVEKALDLYGPPTMKSSKGAVWRNLKIFFDKEVIYSIKIQR